MFTLDVTSAGLQLHSSRLDLRDSSWASYQAPPLLISGSADGQVKFWEADLAHLKPLTVTSPKNTLEHGGRVRHKFDSAKGFETDKRNNRVGCSSCVCRDR